MSRKGFRWWIGLALGFILALAVIRYGKSLYLFTNAWLRNKPGAEKIQPGYADDASRMNRAPVAEVRAIPSDPAGAESQLRDLINLARSKRIRLAIAGARHSMGGHTIYPDGIVIDMLPFNRMELNPETQTLHVGAGARWSEIIPYSLSASAIMTPMAFFRISFIPNTVCPDGPVKVEESVMENSKSGKITVKTIAIVMLIAIITALAVTFIQRLLLGNANPAVTGGVVGAVMAVMAVSIIRKRSS